MTDAYGYSDSTSIFNYIQYYALGKPMVIGASQCPTGIMFLLTITEDACIPTLASRRVNGNRKLCICTVRNDMHRSYS